MNLFFILFKFFQYFFSLLLIFIILVGESLNNEPSYEIRKFFFTIIFIVWLPDLIAFSKFLIKKIKKEKVEF